MNQINVSSSAEQSPAAAATLSQSQSQAHQSSKITELESIVTELRSRMHQLEEANCFLLDNIRNLLDEK